MSMNETELKAKQNSCANCLHVRKPVTYTDPDTWICHAPENASTLLDPISGDYLPRIKLCSSRRISCFACHWQKPLRQYYSDGSSKSVYQLEAEANRTTAKISLRDIKVEDLI